MKDAASTIAMIARGNDWTLNSLQTNVALWIDRHSVNIPKLLIKRPTDVLIDEALDVGRKSKPASTSYCDQESQEEECNNCKENNNKLYHIYLINIINVHETLTF